MVNLIARSNGKRNLFSFASKYCCYHNRNLYERDDYSILDTVLKEQPRYFDDVTKNQIQNGRIPSIIKRITITLPESLMNLVLLLSSEKGSLICLYGTKIDRKAG